nr:hypothetical protein [Tanacetum cinerariifolium]
MIKAMLLICKTRGRGRGGSENEASVSGMGGINEASGGRRGCTKGRGRRSRGMESSVGGEELDEEAFRKCMEEQAREQAKNDADKKEDVDEFPGMETSETTNIAKRGYCASEGRGRGRGGIENEASVSGMGGINEASGGRRGGTRGRGRRSRGMESNVGGEEVVVELGVWVKDTTNVTTEDVDEFPGMETSETTNVAKGGRPPSHIDGVRIYHKNRRRSERIAKIKEKKAFKFDKHGTCSILDKAFDVFD